MFMEEANPDYSPIKDPVNAIEITNSTFAWPSAIMVDEVDRDHTANGVTPDTDKVKSSRSDQNETANSDGHDGSKEKGSLLKKEEESSEPSVDALVDINLVIPKVRLNHLVKL